ncbi:MAG: AAA family ATPase [Pseudohongiella sp.]|nr:AAA family ATPase [Pseudohongiella sp.]
MKLGASRQSVRKHEQLRLSVFAGNNDPIIRLWVLRSLWSMDGLDEFIEGRSHAFREISDFLQLNISQDSSKQSDVDAVIEMINQLFELAEQHEARTPFSETCEKNIAVLSERLGFSVIESRILDFAINIHLNNTLLSALKLLGTPDFYNLPRILSLMLNESEQAISLAISPKSRLISSGLLEIRFSQVRHDLDDILSFLSPSIVERMSRPLDSFIDLLEGIGISSSPCTLSESDFEYMQPHLQLMSAYLEKSLKSKRQGTNILLFGPPGTGKTELSKLLAKRLGCELVEVAFINDFGHSINGEKRLQAFKLCQACFAGSNTIILFDEMENAFEDELDTLMGTVSGAGKGTVNQAIETAPVPAIWVTNHIKRLEPSAVRRFDLVFKMAPPGRRQMLTALQQSCNGWMPTHALSHLADIDYLSPATLRRAIDVVRYSGDDLSEAERLSAVERVIDQSLQGQRLPGLSQGINAEQVTRYDPDVINADINVRQLAAGLATGKNARICLYGPPGTGKTAFAHWLSRYLDMPLIVKRSSDLLGPYIGQTEQNIAEAFSQAREQRGMLLIDEVDGFLYDRKQAAHSWQLTLVNEMLTQMEAFDGVFLASTNMFESLDPASLRRFDLKIRLDYLLAEQAQKMLTALCEDSMLPPPTALHMAALKRLTQLTPGDFALVARHQRFMPLQSADQIVNLLRQESELKGVASPRVGYLN